MKSQENKTIMKAGGNSWSTLCFVFILSLFCATPLYAQKNDEVDKFGKRYEDRITSGGFILSAESNAFIVHGFNGYRTTPQIGGSVGAFIDFKVIPTLVIQMSTTVNYNQFYINNPNFTTQSHLSSWGMEIPLYIMYRLKLKKGGIIYVGGGPYTEFVFDCRLKTGEEVVNPYKQVVNSTEDGHNFFALSDNNSGIKIKFCYEMPCRVQFLATMGISISDILGYPHSSANSYVRPYKAAIGVAYRIR